MFTVKNKDLLVLLAVFNIGAVIASKPPVPTVKIIQIQSCDNTKSSDVKCHSLSKIYPALLENNELAIVRPDNDDFSQKKMEQSIGAQFDNSAVNIIHASGYETIAVLNYLGNKYHNGRYRWSDLSTQPTKPTIVILESPRALSGEYSCETIFYKGLLSSIQQPILNDFSKLPDNVHIIIGSNNNTEADSLEVSDIKKSEHRHAQALVQQLASSGKNVYHITTDETYSLKKGKCGCGINLFNKINSSSPVAPPLSKIIDIIESAIKNKKIVLDESQQAEEIDIEVIKNEARSVRNKLYGIVIGNYLFKMTLASLFAYIIYTTANASHYLGT